MRGKEKGELYSVSVELCANMLAGSKDLPIDIARAKVEDAILSGKAYDKFLEWISAQGGDRSVIENDLLPVGKYTREIRAECDGYLTSLNAESVGYSACLLGAGRITKDDTPDLTAGIILAKKRNEAVKKGDVIATLYSSDENKLDGAEKEFNSAVNISKEINKAQIPLIYKTVR